MADPLGPQHATSEDHHGVSEESQTHAAEKRTKGQGKLSLSFCNKYPKEINSLLGENETLKASC